MKFELRRCLLLAAATLAAVAAATGALRAAPPGQLTTGAMANFIPSDEPAPAPAVKFTDADGNVMRLADLEGRVVLLNFWATWCAPCRAEMKDLDALQAELGGEDFTVVALSVDRKGFEAVNDFYAEQGITHLGRYNEPSMAIPRAFGALGLPTTVLIDADGRIVGRLVGPADWASPEAMALMRWYIDRPRET